MQLMLLLGSKCTIFCNRSDHPSDLTATAYPGNEKIELVPVDKSVTASEHLFRGFVHSKIEVLILLDASGRCPRLHSEPDCRQGVLQHYRWITRIREITPPLGENYPTPSPPVHALQQLQRLVHDQEVMPTQLHARISAASIRNRSQSLIVAAGEVDAISATAVFQIFCYPLEPGYADMHTRNNEPAPVAAISLFETLH